MKNLTTFFILVITLLLTTPTSACTCYTDWSFCETIEPTHHLMEVEVILKYGDPQLEYMDIRILETIQNGITEDSLTITTNGLYCHYPLTEFTVGDTLLVSFSDLVTPLGDENHSTIEFSACKRNFLKIKQTDITGFISPNSVSQNYDDFINNLDACNDLIASENNLELLENKIEIFPNPMNDFAIFKMEKEIRNGVFELYDVTGKLVREKTISGSQFELNRNQNLNAGIYFYKISENGRGINSGKVILN